MNNIPDDLILRIDCHKAI